ncbi:MFS transporter [Aureobasidium pullulans]|uniref:MFS transporter n=1 Tax=Aureobasidium pullulans TaxID=5580 RepID=A0A4S9JF84_AURPU|nr:MFS transporter [Aureobasidium pullulans]
MDSTDSEKVQSTTPYKFSLFRLVRDQARVTPEVLAHRYEGSGTTDDPYLVIWIPEDAGNPLNWSKGFKWTVTMTVAMTCFATAFASSAFSGTLRELVYGFHASTELITAGVSLFVLGFALGPLVWAPLSESVGRQYVFFSTFAAFTAFLAGCAGVNTIGGLLVLRFFAGSFGSSPFTNAGGVISDIFSAQERGLAITIFSLAPCLGPAVGPLVGGFLGENEGWRWVQGLLAIFAGVLWIAGSLIVPETYAPVLLRRRAEELSKRTGMVYMTKFDIERGPISAKQMVSTVLVRPWILLFTEPIVLLLSIYIAIIYGTLYLLFAAFPIVFQLHRGWSEGIGGLAFLGVAVGMFSAIGFSLYSHKWYMAAAAKNGGLAPPEARLIIGMVGSVALPIGMFWFAWSNGPSVHWISPIMAGAPFGFGLTLVFLSVTSYLIDAYVIYAASVLAANTVLRSLFGAAFPLFTRYMYNALGIHWASSIPAFLALLCVPLPFFFYKFGARIRARCTYASAAEKAVMMLMAKAATTTVTTREGSMGSEDDIDIEKADVKDPAELTRAKTNDTVRDPAAVYEASPYDIDRVNTKNSVAGI